MDTLKGIQNKLPEIAAATVNDHELFKELYRFTFKVIITYKLLAEGPGVARGRKKIRIF